MLAAVSSSLARMIFAGGVALVGLPLLWFLVGGAWVLYLLEPGTVVDVDVPVAQPVPPLKLEHLRCRYCTGPACDSRGRSWAISI